MQPDPLETVKGFAEKYGIGFDNDDAALFVSNRLRLAKDPKDPEALRIARHFAGVFHRAKDDVSFEDFITEPRCPFGCPECDAHNRRYAERWTERYKRYDRPAPLSEDL